MNQTELTQFMILILVALQTSYLVYSSWRGVARSSKQPQIFVDTSVLMDGRILPLASTGFIPGVLVVPRSVVRELQLLADKADTEKRERARRGLDVVNKLQALDGVEVKILQDSPIIPEGVDERLLVLAKKYRGSICTIDFNLNKVAQVEDIQILNINELAQQLRMSYLPGDKLRIQLTQPGSDSHQSIGHLEDGTMVVVEQSRKLIGQTVEVEIIRSLQTAAGKMMFAKLVDQKTVSQVKTSSSGRKPTHKTGPKVDPKTTTKATTKRQSNKQRKSGRQDKEDQLIELINRQ